MTEHKATSSSLRNQDWKKVKIKTKNENARGVMVIVIGIGHDDTSSNPGRD